MKIILLQKYTREIIETESNIIMPIFKIPVFGVPVAMISNDGCSEIANLRVRQFNLIAYNKDKTTGIYEEEK